MLERAIKSGDPDIAESALRHAVLSDLGSNGVAELVFAVLL